MNTDTRIFLSTFARLLCGLGMGALWLALMILAYVATQGPL